MTLGRYFEAAEFLCKCGRLSCDAPTVPEPALVALLDAIREDEGEAEDGVQPGIHQGSTGGSDSDASTYPAQLRRQFNRDRCPSVK